MKWTSLFQFNRNSGKVSEETNLWIAYTAFHLGDYKKSMEVNFNEVWLLVKHQAEEQFSYRIYCCDTGILQHAVD